MVGLMPATSRPATDASLQEIEQLAVAIAGEAGSILRTYFSRSLRVDFKQKDQRDPVTEADREVERMAKEAILARFPEHAVLGEEGADEGLPGAAFQWVIDPLDGTTNFINSLPLFASSIGVFEGDQLAAGAIFIPGGSGGRDAIFHASRGSGLFIDTDRLDPPDGLPQGRTRLAAVPAEMSSHWRAGYRALGEGRSLGSVAYEMAMTACGNLHLCMFNRPRVWDVAAGMLLIREGGGRVYHRSHVKRAAWHELVTLPPLQANLDGANPLKGWRDSLVCGHPDAVRLFLEKSQEAGLFKRFVRGKR
jgi:myo-inositol-1(or 4)-monophosphatase